MSHDVTPAAYRTRLGNLPAKSVLALLADQVNTDGYGWPSLEFIADKTEVNLRTVKRIVQVFEEIGLLSRVSRGKGRSSGLQINLALLGGDLRAVFSSAYRTAQRKGAGISECRRDTGADVAETLFDVAETSKDVAETFPPHPHKGGTVKDPLLTPPLDPLVTEGKKKSLDRAVDQLRNGLGITSRRTLTRLAAVIELEAERGEPHATTALGMIAAAKKHDGSQHLLRFSYGRLKFFELGIWKDENRWPWDHELLRRKAEASVGSNWE